MTSPSVDPPPRSGHPVELGPRIELSSAELLRALAVVSPFPLVISRQRDGEIIYCNAKLAEVVGAHAADLIGRHTLDFYHDPADREAVLRELNEQGRVRGREVRLKDRDGRTLWAIFTVEPLELSGEPLLLGALYDVSRRKEVEERLQQSEARFRGFVENSTDLVFALDRQAQLTYLSPNLTRILGYSSSQFIGQSFDALLDPNDRPKLWECTELTRETGNVQPSCEFRMQHEDGSTRWFCSSFVPIKDARGDVVGLTGTAHDITPERQAIEELEGANQSLRDAQLQLLKTEKMASLGMLMAGIAHEIRTPLGAVSSTQRTISQALDKLTDRLGEAFPHAVADAKVGRLLKILKDSARVVADGSSRVTDIVQRLRKFSCAEEAKLCAVDVNSIAEDTLALIHHELKHHVAIQKCFGEGVTLMGYPARLNQVLVNLLVNAAHAIRARGRGNITLETRALGDQIEIKVSDDGVGIPPENLGQIFACGFTTKREEGGSGLGLAISKEIVDAHQGSLEVESEVGHGTTFTITLPRSLSERRSSPHRCRF